MRGELSTQILGEFICEQLKQEIQRAAGCTEVAAASLVVAKAVETLGQLPDQIELTVSPNVYKNGAFAGVPGMTKPGFLSAIALGAAIADSSHGLNLLSGVKPDTLAAAEQIRTNGQLSVKFKRTPSPLHFHAEVKIDSETAVATISGTHSHFSWISRNSNVLLDDPINLEDEQDRPKICTVPVRQLLLALETVPLANLEFLQEGAAMNTLVCKNHTGKSKTSLASTLSRRAQETNSPTHRAQALAGGASEARMTGSTDSVMAIAGSGNHGITNFLGALGIAEALDASHEQTVRALAIASLITIVIKAYTGKLTSFCGCSIAPATGIAAATVYLQGGSVEEMEHAMQSVIGTFAGMLCDGAKISCAYKVSTVVGGAIDLAQMATEGAYIPDGDGILGQTVDETFANLAQLNNPGMKETETTVLGML